MSTLVIVSRKGPLTNVTWYLQIIPRFNRLFANVNYLKNIRCHVEERKRDEKLCHVADYLQWKKIDLLFQAFGHEARNLRLGLATNEMNMFGNLSTNHTSWPVFLIIYTLFKCLCMNRKYMMLSMMISLQNKQKTITTRKMKFSFNNLASATTLTLICRVYVT